MGKQVTLSRAAWTKGFAQLRGLWAPQVLRSDRCTPARASGRTPHLLGLEQLWAGSALVGRPPYRSAGRDQ